MITKLHRRTEAVGGLSDARVIWDAPRPYAHPEKREIHLPPISDMALTEEAIADLRGFVDHEARHILHTQGWNKYTTDFKASSMLKNITNVLEDARVEQKPSDRPGEKYNLAELRRGMLKDIFGKGNVGRDPYSDAVTSIMYTQHGIHFPMTDEAKTVFAKIEDFIIAALASKDIHGVVANAKKIVKYFKDNAPEEKEPDFGQPQDHTDGGDPSDETGESSEESDGEEADDEENSSDGSNGSDDTNTETDGEPDDTEKDDSEEQEESGRGTGKDSTDSGDVGDDDSSSRRGSGDIPESDEVIPNSFDEKKFDEGMEDSDLGKVLADAIEAHVQKDIASGHRFTIYSEGDIWNNYSYDPSRNFTSKEDMGSRDHDDAVKALTRRLVKIFRSRTASFRRHGMTRGKRVSKHRLGAFSSGGTNAPFYISENTEEIKARVTILLDLSGSMNRVLSKVFIFAGVIAETLSQLDVDFEIIGFYVAKENATAKWRRIHADSAKNFDSSYPKTYEVFHSFGDRYTKNIFTNICQQIMHSVRFAGYGRNNDDAAALIEVSDRLMKSTIGPEEQKFLFVVSDGAPTAPTMHGDDGYGYGYGRESFLKETAQRLIKESPIQILALGFSGATRIANFYGEENSIYIDDFGNHFKQVFVAEMEKALKRALS